MKRRLFIALTITALLAACTGKRPGDEIYSPVNQPDITSVAITDQFWNQRIDNNHRVSVIKMFETWEAEGHFPDPKVIEAAGYILLTEDDTLLRQLADRGIERLLAYVLPDGHPRKWKDLLNGEMYFGGHTMEAAIPYFQATGDRKILDAAIILADDICENFGPDKRRDISQHEEVKIGLLKLYHFTGDQKYLDMARFFLDERGHSNNGRELYGEYAQDHLPVIDQPEVVGHAVRGTYLYTPLAELAALTHNTDYIEASDRLWEDATYTKTFLTGHVGTYRDHEDFGEAYELPNLSCWNETCASIGSFFWNFNMFSLHRDAKYADMMERLLYNGILPGVSLDGSKFFYQNPLRSFGGVERHEWFGPNCCPPNVARLFASLGKYIYATSGSDFYVNLYISSKLDTKINGNMITVTQESGLPWEGTVKLTISPDSPTRFTLMPRIPGWTGDSPMPGDLYHYMSKLKGESIVLVNGEEVNARHVNGYISINREWRDGDVVELLFPVESRLVAANPKVKEDVGYVAIERGPLVYCAEGIDNGGSVSDIVINTGLIMTPAMQPDLAGGVVTLTGQAGKASRDKASNGISVSEISLTAVPYFAWAHRGDGEMAVWITTEPEKARIEPGPSLASGATVSSSCGEGTLADNYPGGDVPSIAKRFYPSSHSGSAGFPVLYDEVKPVSSFDGSSTYFALRPAEGDEAWVQYSFHTPTTLASTEVYWKDDRQACLSPASWELFYLENGVWTAVSTTDSFGVEKDMFNRVNFEPVTTSAVRLKIRLQGQTFKKGELGPPDGNYMPDDMTWYETGIIEWQVYAPGEEM
ncbi:MAG: hypothetical protein GX622_05130 [Bacteroidales bacterium]|nr:hypothetical protein [Bacteroidales bacterium]